MLMEIYILAIAFLFCFLAVGTPTAIAASDWISFTVVVFFLFQGREGELYST